MGEKEKDLIKREPNRGKYKRKGRERERTYEGKEYEREGEERERPNEEGNKTEKNTGERKGNRESQFRGNQTETKQMTIHRTALLSQRARDIPMDGY